MEPKSLSPVLTRLGGGSWDDNVLAASWSADSRALALAFYDGRVELLSQDSNWQAKLLATHGGPAACLAMHPKASLVASGGDDGFVHLIDWSQEGTDILLNLSSERLQDDWLQDLVWSADGKHLAAACGSRVFVIDTEGRILQSWSDFPSTVHSLAWHPGGSLLLVASDGGLSQLKPGDVDVYPSFPTDSAAIALSISPQADFLVSGNLDATMNVWAVGDEEPYRMQGYRGKPRNFAWSRYPASPPQLAVAAGTESIILWNFERGAPDGQAPQQLLGHDGAVRSLSFLQKKPWLLSCGEDGRLIIWQETRGWKKGTIDQPGGAFAGMRVSPDERYVAAWTRDARLYLYALMGSR